MFGSTMLEIVIGMVFVFLTTSLAVTATNELLASLLRWRARDLELGIGRLLDRLADPRLPPPMALLPKFKAHALVQSISREGSFPSYISARTFAQVVLDIAEVGRGAPASAREMRDAIEKSDTLPDHVKKVLGALLVEVESDIRTGMSDLAKLREGVERWFNGAMDRVGGWYKRRAQYVSLALAVVLAAAMNLDSIEMARTLSRDGTLRQSLAAQAAQIAQRAPRVPPAPESNPDAAADTLKAYQDVAAAVRSVDDLGLPLGWCRQLPTIRALRGVAAAGWWLNKVLGLLLTALAASLGAPFWFDVLGKFVSIRSTGKLPDAGTARA
jgi:hypothetical protein